MVKLIFNMFSEGIGYVRMTKILREKKMLNPLAYFNQNNPDYYKSDYWRKPYDWHATSIRVILSNRIYLGQLIFGKTKSKGFYNKKRIQAPESEWIVVNDTHEPIITQELWDTVQKMMAGKRRECKNGEIQMFAGLVKCSDCGSALNVSFDANKGKYTGFSCWVYKNYGKQRCSSHAIGWQTLNRLILEDVSRNAAIAVNSYEHYMEMLTQASTAIQKQETEKYKRELKKAQKRIEELERILVKLYEDRALDRIDEEKYLSMSVGYDAEQRELKEKRLALESAISKAEQVYNNAELFTGLIRRYTDIKELDAKTLNDLIDRIIVHEKVTNTDGQKSQRVDIHYKFIGFVPLPVEVLLATPIEYSLAMVP